MPLPTPCAARAVAGLDLTAWWIGRAPRLPGAPAARMGADSGFPIVRARHAEYQPWRPPVIYLDDGLRSGDDPIWLPASERGGVVDVLARRGHAVWLVGPGRSGDAPASNVDLCSADLALAQRLIWGQEARAAFWLDGSSPRHRLAQALPELDARRVAGLVALDAPAAVTLRHRLSGLCRRLVRQTVHGVPGGSGLDAGTALGHAALGTALPLLETSTEVAANAGWCLLTDWLDTHHGHSPERTVRIAAPAPKFWRTAA